jgi:hypothetical protein
VRRDLIALGRGRTDFVNPGIRFLERALTVIGDECIAELCLAQPVLDRKVVNMHEQGFDPLVVEKALNHSVRGVAGVYNRAQYADRRKMLQHWGDYIDGYFTLSIGPWPGMPCPLQAACL